MRTRATTTPLPPEPSRIRRLRDRLPECGYPRGAGAASATAFVVLCLLAGACLLGLVPAGPAGDGVPAGVAAAQRQDAEALAKAVGGAAASAARDLQLVGDSPGFDGPDPVPVLSTLSSAHPAWRGAALLDATTRRLLAAWGEPIAVDALADADLGHPATRVRVQPEGASSLLNATPLTAGRALVVAIGLRLAAPPGDGPRRHVRLVANGGAVLADAGADLAAGAPVRGLLDAAANAAPAGSGVLTAPEPGPAVAVVAYAPVGAELGLAVVTATWLPSGSPAPARWRGLVPAAVLALLAAGSTVVLRRGLVSPIRRLRTGALAVAAEAAAEPVPETGPAEVRRIARAFEQCRRRRLTLPPPTRPGRRGVPARLLVGLVTVSLLGWSAGVLGTLGRSTAPASAALVAEHGLRATRAADAVRTDLNGGLTRLRAAARLNAGQPTTALGRLLAQLAAASSFRSVYVVGGDGVVAQRAGREPLRDGPLPPSAQPDGLRQHNTAGRIPVVYAYAGLGGSRTLVGEFDIARLPLAAAGEHVRVVDDDDRTLVDTQGYLAFSRLTDPALRAATAAVRAGHPFTGPGDDAVVAARSVADSGPAAALHWVVVAERPGSADDVVRDRARAAAILVAVLALLFGSWHELVLIRPLRRVTAAAERVAAGEATEAVYPQRQDEIGTLACCLEICRRGLAEDTRRSDEEQEQLAGMRA
ncbi:HAMP domain-containing protein [Amycolatopsis sp. NPDC003861]